MVRAGHGLGVPGARIHHTSEVLALRRSGCPEVWRWESQRPARDPDAQQIVAEGPSRATDLSRHARADPCVSHVHLGRFRTDHTATFPCNRMSCNPRQAADSALTCDQQRAVAAAKETWSGHSPRSGAVARRRAGRAVQVQRVQAPGHADHILRSNEVGVAMRIRDQRSQQLSLVSAPPCARRAV